MGRGRDREAAKAPPRSRKPACRGITEMYSNGWELPFGLVRLIRGNSRERQPQTGQDFPRGVSGRGRSLTKGQAG